MSISDFTKEEEPKTEWTAGIKSPNPTVEPVEAIKVTEPEPVVNETQKIVDGIINKIGDISAPKSFKMLIYGDPGCTKSSFAATAPNNLVVDLEDGLISAATSPHGVAKNVKPFPYTDFDEFTKLLGLLKNRYEGLEGFDVITLDTISDMHKRTVAEITEREWMKQPSRNRYVPETENYMEVNEKISRVVRNLRDMDRDLIILAHGQTVEPKNKPAKTYPDFSEKLTNKLLAMMDVVGYMSMKPVDGKPTPVLRVISEGTIYCKSRIPLPEEMLDPTWPQIKAVWEETKDKLKD